MIYSLIKNRRPLKGEIRINEFEFIKIEGVVDSYLEGFEITTNFTKEYQALYNDTEENFNYLENILKALEDALKCDTYLITIRSKSGRNRYSFQRIKDTIKGITNENE